MGSAKNKRGYDKLKNALNSEEFQRDITHIQHAEAGVATDSEAAVEDETTTALIYNLIDKYGLLQSFYPVIEAVVAGQSISEALKIPLEPVALIVNHDNQTILPSDDPKIMYEIARSTDGLQRGLFIQINNDASEDELLDFIVENYTAHIKPALRKYKRMDTSYFPPRDNAIRKAKSQGKSVQDIANQYNISVPRVYQILKRKL